MKIFYLVTCLIYLIYINIKFKKVLHMYQQHRYENDTYMNWIIENKKQTFGGTDLCFLLFILFFFLPNKVSMCFFVLFYLIITFVFINKLKSEQSKKPLVNTSRVKRMMFTVNILYLIPISIGLIFFDSITLAILYLILGLFIYLGYILIMLSNFINIPIEKQVFFYYKRKAINKLKSMNNLSVIGITGSYGKTSSKNILNDILNVKYNSFPTPKNYNTPNGLMLTINNYLDKFNDYFIAEMGACRVGEIKELCDLVHPKYGILTKIGSAHLETFLSEENIQKTKFELIESLPKDGVGILNADDPLQSSYKLKNNVKIIWIGIDNKNADIIAKNIKLSNRGTTFDVVFKGDKNEYSFETKLLGYANIYNILAGIALGHYFGISIEQLKLGVKKVNSVEHRLELKKMNDIFIIDDAYNSNPVGSKMALEVLGMMDGKRIVVTPGMIELGSEQYSLNKKFGEYMVNNADEVILIGKEQTKPIYDGLIEKKYNKKKIHILNDVKDAFKLIQDLKGKETYVLLENDLPDIFNE